MNLIELSCRGIHLDIARDSAIIEKSQYLTSYLSRWNNSSKRLWVDVDIHSFNYLIDFFKICKENILNPSENTENTYKLFCEEIKSSPIILSTIENLEIKPIFNEWYCSHNLVSNFDLKKPWHICDGIVYIIYMIKETYFYNQNIIINLVCGSDYRPYNGWSGQATILHALYIEIKFNDNESKKIELGVQISSQDELSYCPTNTIKHRIEPVIVGSIKDIVRELNAGIEQRFYNLVLNMMPGYLNPSKRVNICI